MGDEARRGVPWALLSYAGGKAISVLTTLVLARLLVPADFGLLALASIATNFLYWVADSGLSSAVIVRLDFGPRELGTTLSLIVVAGVVAAAIAIAFAPLADIIFHNHHVAPILIVIALLLPIGSVIGFYESLLLREMLFRQRALATIGQSILSAIVSIVLAIIGWGVWALVVGQVVGYVTLLLAYWALCPISVSPRLDRDTMRESWTSGRGFLAQGMLQYLRLNVDTITVGVAFGQRRLGFYSMANRFGDLVYWLISHPVATVTFPSFAKRQHENQDLAEPFLGVLGTIALVSAPVGALMSAAATPFVHAIFGARWIEMSGPLMVMGLWALVRQIDTTLQWLLNSISHAGAMARVSVVILIPLILGCWLAAEFGGLTTVALVPLGDTILSAAITGWLVQRHAAISVAAQARAVSPAVLAAVPTWVVTWVVGHAIGSTIHWIPALVAAVLAGALTYLICLRLIAPELLRGLLRQLRRVSGREPRPVASA